MEINDAEFDERLRKYLEENLTIDIDCLDEYYGSYVVVSLILDGKTISSSSFRVDKK